MGDVTLASTTSGEGEPLIGSHQRDYIIWDGFILNEANINTKSDTGPVVVWESNNITLKNLRINNITSTWNDNHNAIRLERSTYVTVRNNIITGSRNAGDNRNGCAIMTYYSNDVILEYNDISDSSCGVFVKGVNEGPYIIRYNFFYDLDGEGVSLGGIGTTTAYKIILSPIL